MTLGIAFAGGGARGAAHLGVLQALEENNIVADCYAGTSAGSIIAAMKALGKTNQECLDMVKEANMSLIDIAYLDIIKSLPHKLSTLEGFAKGNKMKEYLSKHLGGSSFLMDLKHPLSIVSTDINTGSQVVFSSLDFDNKSLLTLDDKIVSYGRHTPLSLSNMIYASSSLPGVFQPITYENMKLVDGSATNNLPSDLLKLMGADKVIAINLGGRIPDNSVVNGVFNILSQAANTMIEQNEFLSLSKTEDVIIMSPDIPGVGVLDFNKTMQAYQVGYDYGKSMITYIQQQLNT